MRMYVPQGYEGIETKEFWLWRRTGDSLALLIAPRNTLTEIVVDKVLARNLPLTNT